MSDGTRQCLEGWSVDCVTGALPHINLSKAEADLKEDYFRKNGVTCQEKVPPVVGGNVDILMGMLYNSIFPEHIHSLENRLTIYRLQVAFNDKSYSAVIGGPHESFQFMEDQAGSLPTL